MADQATRGPDVHYGGFPSQKKPMCRLHASKQIVWQSYIFSSCSCIFCKDCADSFLVDEGCFWC